MNGVTLNDITRHTKHGGFTRIQVDKNDPWNYKWGTGNLGGRLDSGTYAILVVNGPNDLSHLSQAVYSTISVTLRKTSVTVDQPALPYTTDHFLTYPGHIYSHLLGSRVPEHCHTSYRCYRENYDAIKSLIADSGKLAIAPISQDA